MEKLERSGRDLDFRQLLLAPEAYARADEGDDALFYERERMVDHLDGCALSTIENLVGALLVEERPAILDLFASVNSHLPEGLEASRVTGLGLNKKELDANPRLTERVIHDLNADPRLPFADESFHAVLNTVSVQYLADPVRIFDEVSRVLKPGGLHLVIFSNRMFETKAVRIWTLLTEKEREELVRYYFQASGGFEDP